MAAVNKQDNQVCVVKQESASTVDLVGLPALSFADVENYAQKATGCKSTQKAYKYFAEPGYLHQIKIQYIDSEARVSAACHRSMKKNEPPHNIMAIINIKDKTLCGTCSCVAGAGGACQHIIGLFFLLAHCKKLEMKSLPDELTCTMMAQRWSIPREKTIEPKCVNNVSVKKPRAGADYNKFIKSSLYSPAHQYMLIGPDEKRKLESLQPEPLLSTVLPDNISSLQAVQTRFGNLPKGCVLSYQQQLTSEYVINDYGCTEYPPLPFTHHDNPRFHNNVSVCLSQEKSAALESLIVSQEMANSLEVNTRDQTESALWHTLRMKRITASKFGIVAKRVTNFDSLKQQLQPSRHVQTAAMKRGMEMESTAASVYATKAKNNAVNLYPSGLVIDPKCPWLACTPDRKVYDAHEAENGKCPYGLLEVKVVCKEGATSFNDVDYIKHDSDSDMFMLNRKHIYYYQVQCQLGLTGVEWCDFFSYINNETFFCERILFDPVFFQESKDKVDDFYFNYFL